MRRTMSTTTVVALLLLASCASDGDGDGGPNEAAAAPETDADAATDVQTDEEPGEDSDPTDAEPVHEHDGADPGEALTVTQEVVEQVADMRRATARYVNDLDAALDDGYFIITQHIEDMGYHFLNPDADGTDLSDPPILVYARDGDDWQLVAFEWVYPEEPEEPPMDGATYGAFPAACHYDDGLFVAEDDEEACAETHEDSGATFTFWHGDLVTFHVWAWKHNPDGLYNGTNPLMSAYNE